MIESPFGFFEVYQKLIFANTFEFTNTMLGICPERLNTINMVFALSELASSVVYNFMIISKIQESVGTKII